MNIANVALVAKYKALPSEMLKEDRFLLWNYAERKDKLTKLPWTTRGYEASSVDPSTWSNFDDALAALQSQSAYDGLGFALGYGYAGIDLDHVRDAKTGVIEPWALDVIKRFDSYTELSPSDTGVHIIVKGFFVGRGLNLDQVEVYCRGRYFTLTGQPLLGSPTRVENRQATLRAYVAELRAQGASESDLRDVVTFEPLGLKDDEVLAVIKRSRQAAKFESLAAGGKAGYESESQADLALCNLLAFYCDDAAQIERIFSSTGRYRDKWRRADYREWTITRAIERQTQHYTKPAGRAKARASW